MNQAQQSIFANFTIKDLIAALLLGELKTNVVEITQDDEKKYIESCGKEIKGADFEKSVDAFFDIPPSHVVAILANLNALMGDESGGAMQRTGNLIKEMSDDSAFFFDRDCFDMLTSDNFRQQFVKMKKGERTLSAMDYEDIAMQKEAATLN